MSPVAVPINASKDRATLSNCADSRKKCEHFEMYNILITHKTLTVV